MAFVARELAQAGHIHSDVVTVMGEGLEAYAQEPFRWSTANWSGATASGKPRPRHPAARLRPVQPRGRPAPAQGDLGRAVIKVSAVKPEHRIVRPPPPSSRPRKTSCRPSSTASSTATSSSCCASRARAPTACPSCTACRPASACSGPRLQGRPGHRRPDVGASGKTPGRHPRLARSPGGRPPGPCAGRRPHPAGRRGRGPDHRRRRRLQPVPAAHRSRQREASTWGYGRELFFASVPLGLSPPDGRADFGFKRCLEEPAPGWTGLGPGVRRDERVRGGNG
jgi:phosphogluconate dehydratase